LQTKTKQKMHSLLLFLFLSSLSTTLIITPTSAAVVVFVHGLAGFGPTELLGVGYWGFPGFYGSGRDYLQKVRDCNIFGSCKNQVYYASVGPISSNWDRACELYAQIKGTRVDYGYKHSQTYGHTRLGKDYTGKGFYPAWSASNPIHLVGHSMGGNTIRMLEYLLQRGDSTEVSGTSGISPGVSNLFKGGNKGWIKSIHTISTPFNGSPLHTALGTSLVNNIKDIILAFGKAIDYVPFVGDWLYDFDLDQFGWGRNSGEDQWSYLSRVLGKGEFTNNFKDLASYDLGPQFAYEFNKKAPLVFPGTFYVTHTTSRTSGCSPSDQCSDGMEIIMSPTGNIIGSMSHSGNSCNTNVQCTGSDTWCQSKSTTPVPFCWTDAWEQNDGLVPKRSSQGPEIGVSGYVAPSVHDSAGYYSWGIWYWDFKPSVIYTTHHNRDHVQIIGLDNRWLWLEDPDTGTYDTIRQDIAWMDARVVTPEEIAAAEAKLVAGGDGGNGADPDTNLIIGLVVPLTIVFGTAIIVAGIVYRRRQSQAKENAEAALSRANSVLSIGSQEAINPAFAGSKGGDESPMKPHRSFDGGGGDDTEDPSDASMTNGNTDGDFLKSPNSMASFSSPSFSSPRSNTMLVGGRKEFLLSRGDSMGSDPGSPRATGEKEVVMATTTTTTTTSSAATVPDV